MTASAVGPAAGCLVSWNRVMAMAVVFRDFSERGETDVGSMTGQTQVVTVVSRLRVSYQMFTDSSVAGGISILLDKACFSVVLWSQHSGKFFLPPILR